VANGDRCVFDRERRTSLVNVPDIRPRYVLAAVAIALLAPFVAYGFSRMVTSGEIPAGVTAAGIDLGGLGEDEALQALLDYEEELRELPAFFRVADRRIQVEPAEFGLDIDEERAVAAAFSQRPTSGLFSNFAAWWGSWGAVDIDIPVRVGYDTEEFDALLASWELEAIADPAFPGDVVVRNGVAEPEYPRAGVGIDRDVAQTLVLEAAGSLERPEVELPTRDLIPQLTTADIDSAVERANQYLIGAITLVSEDPEFTLEVGEADLERAFFIERDDSMKPPVFEMGYRPEPLTLLVSPFSEELEVEPRDAEFLIEDDDTVTLVPSRTGTLIDMELIAEALEEAALTEDRAGVLPFAEGALPLFTTEDALAMGPITKISEFTTQHSPGQPRVENIQRFADEVDGAVVFPGEEFSLNGHVGPRTEADGYVPAPTIIGGEIVDTVGGGVSQFATTFYNAVFYGCYEDITHKPHSYYFTRYPEVNEATINWPEPDLVFRNNSEALVIIHTSYTATSITVTFFGNNGGKVCTRELGQRFNYRTWQTEFRANASLDPGEEKRIQSGSDGWTNTVMRIITHPDGTVEMEPFEWTYRPQNEIIEVHPCMIEKNELDCPIEIPDVIGKTFAQAKAQLEGLGFVVVKGDPISTSEFLDGLVARQSPTSGKFRDAGTTIVLRVGTADE
jgi:vancomycin resistance protein YoaR